MQEDRLSRAPSLRCYIDSLFIVPLSQSLPLQMEDAVLKHTQSYFITLFLEESIPKTIQNVVKLRKNGSDDFHSLF